MCFRKSKEHSHSGAERERERERDGDGMFWIRNCPLKVTGVLCQGRGKEDIKTRKLVVADNVM